MCVAGVRVRVTRGFQGEGEERHQTRCWCAPVLTGVLCAVHGMQVGAPGIPYLLPG